MAGIVYHSDVRRWERINSVSGTFDPDRPIVRPASKRACYRLHSNETGIKFGALVYIQSKLFSLWAN